MPSLEPHPSVVCTVLDDGGVLLHLDTKFYYSLNRTGLAIWLCLEDRAGDPRQLLAARFPDAGAREKAVTDFFAELAREKLVSQPDPGLLPGQIGRPGEPERGGPASGNASATPAGSTSTPVAGSAIPSSTPVAGSAIPACIAGLTAWEEPVLTRHAVPLSRILSNPFDPSVPLAE